jgi:hypothetical protein
MSVPRFAVPTTKTMLRIFTVGALLAASLSACSLLLQTDSAQCATNADCHARGAAFANAVCIADACESASADAGVDASSPLGCLGSVKAPPTPPASTIAITMAFFDEVSPATPLSGIAVQACSKLDVTCTNPITGVVTSDAEGDATLQVAAGFDGYLQINGPSTVPALWYFSPFPVKDGTFNVGLLSPASFQDIASAVGTTIDPDAGHAFDFALDCTATYGTFVAGMSFASNETTSETRGFYLVNGLPNTTATATDISGIGGFANLPTGVSTITATVAASSERSGSVSVLIRPGVITYSPIAPSP